MNSDRIDYTHGSLDVEDLLPDPFEMLDAWIAAAFEAGCVEPSAFCLSTVSPECRPSSRIVLMRGRDSDGVWFFTNRESQKGSEIRGNPAVCATFFWPALQRQVRLTGHAERLPDDASDAYFASRPRSSQIGAHASPQSRVIASRLVLEEEAARFEALYPDSVPRPEHWGGYRLVVDSFEFWQGRASRLHDRFRFLKAGEDWVVERLAP